MLSVNLLTLVVLLLAFVAVISCQSTGRGGGTCYEEKVAYACPTYNYTRTGSGDSMYEQRTYDLNTWVVESLNISIIMASEIQAIEGMVAVYPPLDAYFHGANEAKLNITRNVAPVSVINIPIAPGVAYAYAGIFFLPPLDSYPPPEPTNNSIAVAGGSAGGALQLWSQSFMLNTIPTDDQINAAASKFAQQLANDGVKFQNISIVSFYDAIDATGNWTKEVWYLPQPEEGRPSVLTSIMEKIPRKFHREMRK